MRKIAIVAATIFAAWSVSACAGGVGIVDMKTIFATSPKVKAIKTQLSTQFTPEKNKLEKMGQQLQADIAKYQKNKTVMKKADLTALQTNIMNQESQFRTAQAKFQQEVFDAQNKSLTTFMASVKDAVKKVAVKEDLDLVVPSNDVLYTKGKDITQDVLKDLQ